MQEYLRAGVRLIWTVWPKTQTVEVWQPTPTSALMLNVTAILDGDPVLSGFQCTVNEMFN